MAYYLKPRGVSTGCCECSQHNNCECGGAACGIQCRSKADNAELCGYAEFGTPSVPPRKFRKKRILGTIYSAQWSVAGCPDGASDPVTYSKAIVPEGFWGDAAGSATAEPVEIDVANNRVKYRLTARSFTPNSTATGWGNMDSIRVVAAPNDGGASETAESVGDEFWLSRSATKNPWRFFIQGHWSLAGWVGNTGSGGSIDASEDEIDVSKVVDESIRDEWDITNEFANAPGCTPSESDLSKRYAKQFGEYQLASGGDEEEWSGFAGDPADAYGALAELTEETQTIRTTSGKGDCQGGGPYLKAEGDVTEQLTLEDTEEDAYNRSASALTWNTTGPCKDHTTYITERGDILGPYGFGFRIAQVRAALANLTNGTSYTVTFRIWRRAFNSTSPYAPYLEMTVEFVASATTGYTEWQEVPVERGYETRVMSCKCVANS